MPARVLISVVCLILFVGTMNLPGLAQQSSPTPQTGRAEFVMLPPSVLDADLRAAHGRSFKLQDYSGKVLVVSLWATWCGPCRFETPELIKLYEKHRADGVEVVELSTEHPRWSTSSVRRWIRDYKVPYRVGWANREVATTLMNGRDAIPQTFVISRSGRIIRRFIGFNPQETPSQFKLAIEEALNETLHTPLPKQ